MARPECVLPRSFQGRHGPQCVSGACAAEPSVPSTSARRFLLRHNLHGLHPDLEHPISHSQRRSITMRSSVCPTLRSGLRSKLRPKLLINSVRRCVRRCELRGEPHAEPHAEPARRTSCGSPCVRADVRRCVRRCGRPCVQKRCVVIFQLANQ